MTFNYGNHQEKSPEGLGLIAGFLSQLWITSPQEGWTPIMWGSQLTALPVKHPKCNPHEWKVKEKPPFDFIEMKKNVSPSVSLSDHSSLSTAGLAWGKVNLFLKAEGDGTEFPVTCPNLTLILSNLTWWKLMWCSLLLWTETFALHTRCAVLQQRVRGRKWNGLARLFVLPAQRRSEREERINASPKPELGQKISALGATWVKTLLLNPQGAESRASPWFSVWQAVLAT